MICLILGVAWGGLAVAWVDFTTRDLPGIYLGFSWGPGWAGWLGWLAGLPGWAAKLW